MQLTKPSETLLKERAASTMAFQALPGVATTPGAAVCRGKC